MADLTLANVSMDFNSANRVLSGVAGEDLPAGSPVYMAADGKIKKAVSTQCTIATIPDFLGVVVEAVKSGKPVTVFGKNTRVSLVDSGLVPGSLYWISGNAGKISDAKVAAGDTPFAMAVSSSDAIIVK